MKNDTINPPIKDRAIEPNISSLKARIRSQMIVTALVRNIGINLSAMLILKLSSTDRHLLS
jgi:hypothetical protein